MPVQRRRSALRIERGPLAGDHEVLDANEAHHFMGNGIVVNGRYITPHLTRQLESILLQEGLTPVVVETSEFEKAGGSCFCMKTFLP